MKQHLQKTVFSFFIALLLATTVSAQGWWFRRSDCNLTPRSAAVGFSVGTAGFIGTGYDSSSYKRNFSLYNQGTNLWGSVTSLGGSTGSGLSRDAATSFTIGTKGY